MWGLFGYALLGELELERKEAAAVTTDVGLLMGAFGARGTLVAAPPGGGFELAATSDGLVLRMRSAAAAGLVATSAEVQRLRVLLQAAYRGAPFLGGRLTPAVEVGARYDGGDAENGAGLLVGGSLGYTVPAAGLSLAASGGGLLLHESGTFSEWGAGGSLRLTPGVAGRGVALRVEPTWGTAGGSAVRLWTAPGAARAGNAATVPAGRLTAELSYGVAAFRGHGLLTPYAGVVLSDRGERTWRLGGRLNLDPGFSMSVEGIRSEHAGGHPAPEHTLMLRGSLVR